MRTVSMGEAPMPVAIGSGPSMTTRLLQALAAVLDRLASRRGIDTMPPPEWFRYPPF
jgi:hypothetical protein